ncbi:MAG: FAD-dependent oxidoreductase [Planctomycetota bacterium]
MSSQHSESSAFALPHDPFTRIVIVGAGPSGLSAAYFLKQRGYRDVLVLEKQGRVGGLCLTVTEDYKSFDLGANYVTPAYHETLRLAKEVGAKLYPERPGTVIEFPDDSMAKPVFREFWDAVVRDVSPIRFLAACLKYVRLRFRLGAVIDPPGLQNIHKFPELCVPFATWLQRNGLECLSPLFEIPITVMGYGYLHEIATPYALKYMSLATFVPLCLKAFPPTSFIPWPKRFVRGFQRLWEVVAWDLNVRTDVNIHRIERSEQGVRVRFTHEQQKLNEVNTHEDELEFDYLLLTCPLTGNVLSTFMTLSSEEETLFGRIERYNYCLTSFLIPGIGSERPIACTIPLAPIGTPWAITKQMADSDFVQFYSRVDPAWSEAQIETELLVRVHESVRRLGGDIQKDEWHTFDQWPYFEHVSAEDMASGFYERLEALQGKQCTYYLGGVMNFELVESVIQYSRSLVERFFPMVDATQCRPHDRPPVSAPSRTAASRRAHWPNVSAQRK